MVLSDFLRTFFLTLYTLDIALAWFFPGKKKSSYSIQSPFIVNYTFSTI